MLIGGLPEDVIDADRNLSVSAEPPKGSTGMLTVSDVQNRRTAGADIGVSDRMAALESHMQRRQFGEARRT